MREETCIRAARSARQSIFLGQIMKFLASLTLRRRHRSPRHALASLDMGESRSTAGAEEDAAAGPSETIQRPESIIEQVVNGSSEWAKYAPQFIYRLSDLSVRKVSHQVHHQRQVGDLPLCVSGAQSQRSRSVLGPQQPQHPDSEAFRQRTKSHPAGQEGSQGRQ